MLVKAFRKFREICKKEVEMNKALHRLAAMPIDYQTIQVICDNVSSGYNVEVTITNNDGSKINIKRGTATDVIPYKSFAERFKDYQNGVK